MLLLTAVSLDPLTLCTVVKLSKEPLVFPYLNDAYVDNPLAFTVPFRVAELVVTFVASLVVTVGGAAYALEGYKNADTENRTTKQQKSPKL